MMKSEVNNSRALSYQVCTIWLNGSTWWWITLLCNQGKCHDESASLSVVLVFMIVGVSISNMQHIYASVLCSLVCNANISKSQMFFPIQSKASLVLYGLPVPPGGLT